MKYSDFSRENRSIASKLSDAQEERKSKIQNQRKEGDVKNTKTTKLNMSVKSARCVVPDPSGNGTQRLL